MQKKYKNLENILSKKNVYLCVISSQNVISSKPTNYWGNDGIFDKRQSQVKMS